MAFVCRPSNFLGQVLSTSIKIHSRISIETLSDNQGGDKVDGMHGLKLDRKLTIDLEVQPSPRPNREYKRVKDMAIVLNCRHMNMRSERRIYLVPLRTSEPS